jgi:hypothetical protein
VLPATGSSGADDTFERALAGLALAGRHADAALARAASYAFRAAPEPACRCLTELIERAPAGPAGWNIAVEPAFIALRGLPEFDRILERVAERAK